MTTAADPHEEFEIAALRRARGALDGAAVARLDAHLATCAACHGFAATAGATEATFRGRVRAASDGRDWSRVWTAFRARQRADRNRKLRGLASLVVMVGLDWWALGPTTGTILTVFLVGILAFAWWRFVVPERRRAKAAESTDTEMLAFYRGELDKEIRGLRGARQLIVVLMMLYAANLLLMIANVVKEMWLGHGFPDVESYIATFVVFTLVGGGLWFRGRFVLPRLERERMELGE